MESSFGLGEVAVCVLLMQGGAGLDGGALAPAGADFLLKLYFRF